MVAAQPLITIERIGDATPRPLPPLAPDDRPLTGLKVLDLTRILAGPIAGRALAAYGETGPWAGRRGFDSLVQTATGFNHAEAVAGAGQPKALPMQIVDHASGHLMALGAQAALIRQQRQGGTWQVRVSLARTAHWLRSLGRVPGGFDAPAADFTAYTEETDSGWGRLVALRHAARFSGTPAAWTRPSVRPGTHPPRWPAP